MNSETKKQYSFSTDEETGLALEAKAKIQDRSVSWLINYYVKCGINESRESEGKGYSDDSRN